MKICKTCKSKIKNKNYTKHIKECSYNILADCSLWKDAKCHFGYIDCIKNDCQWFKKWSNEINEK